MRISSIVPLIAKRYLNEKTRKRALFFKGKSGIGKSDAVRQASAFLSKHVDNWGGVIDLRLSQKEPTDLAGLPYVEGGLTKYAMPAFMPAEGTCGFIFFDELTSAPPAVQAASYQYILDRCLGTHKIPDGWMVICAGNEQSDRGVTFQIAAPLLNRMCEITVTTVLDDFINYAIPVGLKPEIASFLKDRPEFLHKFESKGVIEPFPSPRSWFGVSESMDLDLQPQDRVEMFKGDVGYEAATTFETHLRFWETLPRLDDIFAGRPYGMPKDINIQYAIAMGIAARVDPKTFDNAWKVLEQMGKDIQTLCIKLAYKRDKGIMASPSFTKWASLNQAAFKK